MACLASLAAHTDLEINAFPHRQLFGAYGAALKVYHKLNGGIESILSEREHDRRDRNEIRI
jgi:hypothetical protein